MDEFTREDFERNFNILSEKIHKDQFRINSSISIEGLLRVHKTPNGRIDFLTVDESARSIANMMGWTSDDQIFEKMTDDKNEQK